MPLPLLPVLGLAAGSAIAGGLSSHYKSKPKVENINRFNPMQQGALNNLLSQGQQNTNFDAIAQQARNQYNNQFVPGLAERFLNMPGTNSSNRGSSSFTGAAYGGGAALEDMLAAQRGQFGLQQLGLGLTPQTEQIYHPSEHNFTSGALGGLSSGLGSLASTQMLGNILNPQAAASAASPVANSAGQEVANLMTPQSQVQNAAPISPQQQFFNQQVGSVGLGGPSQLQQMFSKPGQFGANSLSSQVQPQITDPYQALKQQNPFLSSVYDKFAGLGPDAIRQKLQAQGYK